MRRLSMGEGKSCVQEGTGWWGWGLLRGSQRDRGTIMITGRWWRTLQGEGHDILPTQMWGPARTMWGQYA